MIGPVLAGLGLVVAGVAAIRTAQSRNEVPRTPLGNPDVTQSKTPYYNPWVRQSLRRSAAFAYFSRRQHTITEGTPEVIDSTGMTKSQKEAWIRSVERIKLRSKALGG